MVRAAVVMVREVSAWVVEVARAPAMAGVEEVGSAAAAATVAVTAAATAAAGWARPALPRS